MRLGPDQGHLAPVKLRSALCRCILFAHAHTTISGAAAGVYKAITASMDAAVKAIQPSAKIDSIFPDRIADNSSTVKYTVRPRTRCNGSTQDTPE